MSNESKDLGPIDVQIADLKYMVAILAKDQKWYVKASFATKGLAEAYASGMETAGVQARVVWDDSHE